MRQSKGAVVRAEKAEKHPIPLFIPQMNKTRQLLVNKMNIALVAHESREEVGDMRHLNEALDFNAEFVERSRGKGGKARRYVKSVALQIDNTTLFPSDKRNGAKERARRLAA
jgi:hypothetical protein